jgi:hypothetical protein
MTQDISLALCLLKFGQKSFPGFAAYLFPLALWQAWLCGIVVMWLYISRDVTIPIYFRNKLVLYKM